MYLQGDAAHIYIFIYFKTIYDRYNMASSPLYTINLYIVIPAQVLTSGAACKFLPKVQTSDENNLGQ